MTWRVRLPVLALIAVTAAGGVLRFYRIDHIDHNGFWLDEAFSVWMAQHPLPDLFAWLTRIDQHPPLYYALLHFWLPAGDAEGYVRALSAGLSTLTIPVLYGIGWRIGGAPVGLAAALLLALSPFQVRYAQEARMYALLTLSVALAVWGLVGILTGTDRARLPSASRLKSGAMRNPPRWVGDADVHKRYPCRNRFQPVSHPASRRFQSAAALAALHRRHGGGHSHAQHGAVFSRGDQPVCDQLYSLPPPAARRSGGCVRHPHLYTAQLAHMAAGAGGRAAVRRSMLEAELDQVGT